jgi:hypothetical protein
MSYSDGFPPSRPVRPDGWTVARQQAFLEGLSQHGRVAVAADGVGMSVASAYRLRGREAAFAFGWRAATALAYERLRDVAFDRALNGVVAPRFYRGQAVGEVTRHSDRLLLGLLNHLRPEGGINPATGVRHAPVEAATLWAAAVDAYDTAIETGGRPLAPQVNGEDVKKAMTREEFIAVIMARPHPDGIDDSDGCHAPVYGEGIDREANRETPSSA